MNEFKVGDIVECIKKSALGHAGIVGSIHVVTKAIGKSIWFDGEEAGADVDRFKLYKPAPPAFTKASLKDGMVVTLRNGGRVSACYLIHYNEDLTHKHSRDYDIIKVEQTIATTLYERQENTAALQKIEELRLSAKKLAEQIAELEQSL